jgi:hypothetical protein
VTHSVNRLLVGARTEEKCCKQLVSCSMKIIDLV